MMFLSTCIINILLVRSGVEENPGPTIPSSSKLSFCHWNVDGLLARDGIKISCIESVVQNYNFDLFAIGESTLSAKIPDEKLRIHGFTSLPFRVDCKSIETKAKGGVLMYYKDHLPIKRRTDLEIIDEMIVAEIKLKKYDIFVIVLYRSPSQSSDDLKKISKDIASLTNQIKDDKPLSHIIFTGDFNARSPFLWEN